MKKVLAIGGFIAANLGLWGGAYLAHIVPVGDWRVFPVFMTVAAVDIGGIFACAWGCMWWLDKGSANEL